MTSRRWVPGAEFTFDGMTYRTARGSKAPDDIVLMWKVTEFRWREVKMGHGFLFADFFYENEDVLYPPSRGFEGGKRYLRFSENAVVDGWQKAAADLEEERRRAAQRRAVQLTTTPRLFT